MSSFKYYAVSFGVLMALTGSVIVLADEVEDQPLIQEEEKEEVSYVFEDVTEPVIEEEVIIIPETSVEEPVVEAPAAEVTETIIVEESTQESAVSGPILRSPAGWGSDENGIYYEIENERAKDVVTFIDGNYYGFNPSGYLIMDERFEWNTYWYQAKEDGILCRNEWYKFYDVDCYYGNNARGLVGLQNVDGQNYYFDNGRKETNMAFEWDGNPYYVDDTGKVTLMDYNGWYYVPKGTRDMNTYLVDDGSLINSGVYQYNGAYYYFYPNGQLSRNMSNTVYGSPTYAVRSRDDGSLIVNNWYYETDYGEKYYYGAQGKSASGFTTVDGKNYYFANYGKLMCNTAETIGGNVYIFEENGTYSVADADGWYDAGTKRYYISNGRIVKDTVVNDGSVGYYLTQQGYVMKDDVLYSSSGNCFYGARFDGSLVKNGFWRDYYFGADGKSLSDGFVTINDYDYYIENGRYLTNTIRSINGNNYIFDLAGTASIADEGITENINTYYVLNGALATGFYNISGKDAYFENGIMLKNGAIQVADNEYMVADRDGNLLKDSFYTFDYLKSPIFKYAYPNYPFYFYGTVYLNSEGKAVQGLQTIDGRRYYFGEDENHPYQMYKNTIFTYNGQRYKANANGVCQEDYTYSGWVVAGDDWYLIIDDEIIADQLYTLAGNTYALDTDGKLIKNGFFSANNPKYHVYRTDADGKIIKGQWVTVENEGKLDGEYYFYSDGTGANDFCTIGGKQYYFDNGRKVVSEIRQMNGALFRFREDGTFTTLVSDGVYEGRSLQVVRNGVLVHNEVYHHMGWNYLIDGTGNSKWNDGVQVVNWVYGISTPYYVYANADGPLKRYPQIVYGGDYAYFATDASNLVYGYLENYFGNSYAIVRENDGHGGFYPYLVKNAPVTIKGVDYYADENGVLHQVMQSTLHSLSLTGNIGVNFYYSFTDYVLQDEGAKVEFTVDDVTTSILVKDSSKRTLNGYSYRIFTDEVTSVQLATKIAAKVILSDGGVVFKEEYAPKDYAMNVINSATTETELTQLMKALLVYGGHAQRAFNHNTDDLAYSELANHDVSDVTAATLQPYAFTATGSAAGLNYYGSTLALDSLTSINHIFTLSSGHTIDEYTFKLGDKTITPIKRGSRYYVVIPDIYSKDLDTPFALTVGNYTISYSALSYGYRALISDTSSPELKDVIRALYKYNQAANVFFSDY